MGLYVGQLTTSAIECHRATEYVQIMMIWLRTFLFIINCPRIYLHGRVFFPDFSILFNIESRCFPPPSIPEMRSKFNRQMIYVYKVSGFIPENHIYQFLVSWHPLRQSPTMIFSLLLPTTSIRPGHKLLGQLRCSIKTQVTLIVAFVGYQFNQVNGSRQLTGIKRGSDINFKKEIIMFFLFVWRFG